MKNEMIWVVNDQVTKMQNNQGSFNKLKESVQHPYFGSTTDSEQVFLDHAFYKMLSEDNNQIEKQCRDLLKKHKNKQCPVVGLIIHIHTTRDCCQSCAYSLGNELAILHNQNPDENDRESKKGILSLKETLQKYNNDKLDNKEESDIKPFITFMVSCKQYTSTKKELKDDDDYMLGRRTLGIPLRWILMNITKYKKNKYNNENYNQEVIKALVGVIKNRIDIEQSQESYSERVHEAVNWLKKQNNSNNKTNSKHEDDKNRINENNNNNTDKDDKKEDNNSDDKQEQGYHPFVEKETGRICLDVLLATGGYFLQWMVKKTQSQN